MKKTNRITPNDIVTEFVVAPYHQPVVKRIGRASGGTYVLRMQAYCPNCEGKETVSRHITEEQAINLNC